MLLTEVQSGPSQTRIVAIESSSLAQYSTFVAHSPVLSRLWHLIDVVSNSAALQKSPLQQQNFTSLYSTPVRLHPSEVQSGPPHDRIVAVESTSLVQ
ncbi:hypothetical protein PENTCL1PPCAC_24775 [Pristionchus entomophagus]|uniref:Uncharacterized protein n=1 Tax=Pristionchus entomophagus TaxID=358040 RepID=A0AAV5U827_9BILA|nr:hypothetical protein PENTCL1PPCAC_24775 [Pristionchus entomophagus]